MRLPVDTSAVSFVTAGSAEPAFAVGARDRMAHENRQTKCDVFLSGAALGARDVIPTKVTVETKDHGRCIPVRANGLAAIIPECQETS